MDSIDSLGEHFKYNKSKVKHRKRIGDYAPTIKTFNNS